MYAALFSYVGKCGAPCRRVGGRLDGPCSDFGHHGISCTRTMVASRVGVQRTAVMSSGGLEGVADVGPYGAQWQVRKRPVPARSTASKLLPQCPAWVCTRGGGRHAVNSGRDGAPPA
jgi:hypothetical protein